MQLTISICAAVVVTAFVIRALFRKSKVVDLIYEYPSIRVLFEKEQPTRAVLRNLSASVLDKVGISHTEQELGDLNYEHSTVSREYWLLTWHGEPEMIEASRFYKPYRAKRFSQENVGRSVGDVLAGMLPIDRKDVHWVVMIEKGCPLFGPFATAVVYKVPKAEALTKLLQKRGYTPRDEAAVRAAS